MAIFNSYVDITRGYPLRSKIPSRHTRPQLFTPLRAPPAPPAPPVTARTQLTRRAMRAMRAMRLRRRRVIRPLLGPGSGTKKEICAKSIQWGSVFLYFLGDDCDDYDDYDYELKTDWNWTIFGVAVGQYSSTMEHLGDMGCISCDPSCDNFNSESFQTWSILFWAV